jgi:hypothetical protein
MREIITSSTVRIVNGRTSGREKMQWILGDKLQFLVIRDLEDVDFA